MFLVHFLPNPVIQLDAHFIHVPDTFWLDVQQMLKKQQQKRRRLSKKRIRKGRREGRRDRRNDDRNISNLRPDRPRTTDQDGRGRRGRKNTNRRSCC